jgi:hypothetical protein
MAFEAGLGAVLGLPALSWAMFMSGIMAVLMDLDHVELPPHRTPVCHSMTAAIFWTYVAGALAVISSPAAAAPAICASFCAFVTHLTLDLLTRGGIFLWPRCGDILRWSQPVDEACLVRLEGHAFLASDEKDHQAMLDGELAWPAWARASLAIPPRLRIGGLAPDMLLSAGGLVGVLLAVIAA